MDLVRSSTNGPIIVKRVQLKIKYATCFLTGNLLMTYKIQRRKLTYNNIKLRQIRNSGQLIVCKVQKFTF